MNNTIFGETMENVRKHRDIKLVTTERTRNSLVSEPNYHTTKFFTEHLLAKEMQNCVIWTQIVLLYAKNQMIFTKILQKMLKQDLTLQSMN